MGIWIRSQDKCKMGKCAEFYIDDSYDGDYDIEGYSVDDTPIILGTYSTKEKAIKVLDNFNTSYVVIKLLSTASPSTLCFISIHLMLLLNDANSRALHKAQKFQYILCCY